MSKFELAGPAEILRASQKDDEYKNLLKHLVSDISQRSLGLPLWVKWQNLINTLSDILFYCLTTLSGLQTLGEEYVNILQVDTSLRRVPPQWRRIVDVCLQTLGYYTLLRFQRMVENHVDVFAAVATKFGARSQEAVVASYLPYVFKAITLLQRIHLIAFYFSGLYYTIPKRITGIQYVVIRRWLTHPSYAKPFRVLGVIAASQLCLGLVVNFFSSKLSLNKTDIVQDTEGSPSDLSLNQCSLCLEKRNFSTLTPCGHLFCWSCITSWLESKEECPLCREKFEPSKIIYLQNY